MPWTEPFVGRAAELAVLAGALDAARDGRPSVVLVEGEPGIGKTTLLRRFVDDVPGPGAADAVTVVRAAADEAEVALPFGVVDQLVADLPPGTSRSAPSPSADPLAVGAELLATLGALEGDAPVLLVVDDAQWVDDPSAGALAFAVRRLRRDRVLVVLGVRDPDGGPGTRWWDRGFGPVAPQRVVLGGLGADEIGALAADSVGPLTPAAAERLREHTDGHPLHVAALLRELPHATLLDTSTPLPAPRSLTTLVLVTVAGLAEAARELVLAAAVLGDRCPLAHAVALAAPADPVAALDEAVRAGLLVEITGGTRHDVAFTHQLVRAAVHGDLPPARRHELHSAAAELVGGTAATAHRVAAAVGPDEKLATELTTLGREDVDARRWRAAADHLLAAADLSATPDARAARLIAGVDAMLAGGDLRRALRSEPDVRALPPGPARSRVVGRLEAATGRFRDAHVSLADALDGAGADVAGRAAAAAHLSLLSFVEGDVDAAAELSRQALDRVPPPEDEPTARFVRIVAEVVRGGDDEVDALLAKGGSPEVAGLRGVVALWRQDAAAAAEVLTGVVRDGAADMSMQGRILLLAHLAEAQYRTGDWNGSAANGALAVSLARDAGVLVGAGLTNALTSYVASGRGEWELATARVEAAEGATRTLPWWGGQAYAATARAVLAQARGDAAGMLAALAPLTGADDTVARPVVRAVIVPWRTLLAEGQLGTGDLDAAAATLDDLDTRLTGPPGWTALEAARLRAELAELRSGPAAAREPYEHAMELAGRIAAEPVRARVEAGFGRALVAAGERRPGVDLLRTAHDRLTRLGAAPFAERADELLRAAGLHPPAAGGALALTPQELAVARLVAEGRTNSEVGASLFVTGRTVAFHLSNIYAKLGISSRRQLAAHL